MKIKPTYDELELRVKKLEGMIEKHGHAKKILQESEQKYRTLFESSADALSILDVTSGRFVDCNRAAVELHDTGTRENFVGSKPDKLSPEFQPKGEPSKKLAMDYIEKAIREGKVTFEWVHCKRDGTPFPVFVSLSAMRLGEEDLVMAIERDMTELKLAQEKLQLFSDIVQNMQIGLYVYHLENENDDHTLRMIAANPVSTTGMGIMEQQIVGKYIDEIFPALRERDIPRHFAEVVRSQKPFYEENFFFGDEQVSPSYFSFKAFPLPGACVGVLFEDISDRKKAEEDLSITQFAIEHARDAVYWMGPDARLFYVNKAACRVLGYSKEELLTKTVHDFAPEFPASIWSDHWADLKRRGSFTIETFYRKKDGTDFPVETSVNFIKFGEKEFNFAFARDVSDRQIMHEELVKAKKLESVGTLAGGMAHDFNNLLSVILGNISIADEEIGPESNVSEYLHDAEKACLQARELTKQLITFSKGGAPVKKRGLLGSLLNGAVTLSISGSNVKSEILLSEDLWPVEFDEGQMKHAISNVVVNAVEAMPKGGILEVRAANCLIESEYIEQGVKLKPGKYVKVSFHDHGIGIPFGHLSRIFDPYFSTKQMGSQKGMGLGLSTTYSILKKHKGYITVESSTGKGTVFYFYLPVASQETPKVTGDKKRVDTLKGKILIMEDEDMLGNLALQMMERLGYEAELAKEGNEALELYEKAMASNSPFDAVILDLTIRGGVGGKATIKQIMRTNPKVKAIVSSGYSSDPVMTNFRAYGFSGVMEKPYSIQGLKEALEMVLNDQ